MTDWLIDYWSDAERRLRVAVRLFVASVIGWPLTHLLILVLKPAEFSSWPGHLMLALSWLAIIFVALDLIITADQATDD